MRSITLCLLLMLCSAWRGWAQEAQVQLVFLDVGQGDAIVVRSPEAKTALIDSGNDGGIVSQLHALGIDTIDIAIASHPHADHIGGMTTVLWIFRSATTWTTACRTPPASAQPRTKARVRSSLRGVGLSDRPTVRPSDFLGIRVLKASASPVAEGSAFQS